MKKLLLTLTLVLATVNIQAENTSWADRAKNIWTNHKQKIVTGLVVTTIAATVAVACVCDQKFNEGTYTNPVKDTIVGQCNKFINLFKTNNSKVPEYIVVDHKLIKNPDFI